MNKQKQAGYRKCFKLETTGMSIKEKEVEQHQEEGPNYIETILSECKKKKMTTAMI